MELQLQLLTTVPSVTGAGGVIPPVGNRLLTEASEFFITESGDPLVQE